MVDILPRALAVGVCQQALKTMEQAMIVSELIEALQQMPEDRTVMLYYDADLDTPDRVYINESPFENENGAVVIY